MNHNLNSKAVVLNLTHVLVVLGLYQKYFMFVILKENGFTYFIVINLFDFYLCKINE